MIKPCTNWSKALGLIKDHAKKLYHKNAVAAADDFLHTMESPQDSIVSQVNVQSAENIAANRQVLTSLFRFVPLCGRQGLALRGDNNSGVMREDNR